MFFFGASHAWCKIEVARIEFKLFVIRTTENCMKTDESILGAVSADVALIRIEGYC